VSFDRARELLDIVSARPRKQPIPPTKPQQNDSAAQTSAPDRADLGSAVNACRGAVIAAGAFSLFINLLLLASPLYMMQVYDRVLGSRNETTLVMLSIIAAVLFGIMGVLEMIRARILVRAGIRFDALLNNRVFAAVFTRSLRTPGGVPAQALRDLDAVREFVGGVGVLVFCDAPWAPLFIGLAFLLHPLLGWVSLTGAALILVLALINEKFTRKPLKEAAVCGMAANAYAETSLRNAEVIEAMGMLPGIASRWMVRHDRMLDLNARAGDRGGYLLAGSKLIRLLLQSGILGVGAYLAIHDELSAGAIMAASIIMGRALAPVEMAVGQWKNFVHARTAWARLRDLLAAVPPRPETMALPDPAGALSVEGVFAAPPLAKVPVLKGISFALEPGEVLGVIGPSAAGKSSLARVLVGVWQPYSGAVRIDGAEITRWDRRALGPHIGYLPQDVELFDGTVAENIARFQAVDSEAVVEAARKAGVHEMILRLPEGYDTRIGEGGRSLSGGQRQRLGLARALYHNPALLILDEPNSNLDTAGDQALIEAVNHARDQGSTVVIISHRLSILGSVDKVLVLNQGMVEAFGSRDEVLSRVARPTIVPSSAQPPSNTHAPAPAAGAQALGYAR
jgi:PrtD family type I secretion system ABC transporter